MVLRGKAAVAVVVALGIAAGSVAYAAIPDGAGVIHGCYKNGNGQLRVVNVASDCSPSEVAIEWNETGTPGPPGPKGATGDKGDTGDFSGTFESPNHLFKLVVANDGIELRGPSGFVTIGPTDMEMKVDHDLQLTVGAAATVLVGGAASLTVGGNTEIAAGGSTKITAGGNAQFTAGGDAAISIAKNAAVSVGSDTDFTVGKDAAFTVGNKASVSAGDDVAVQGLHIQLNGCKALARVGDQVLGSAGSGGAVTAQITTGSTTVCAG